MLPLIKVSRKGMFIVRRNHQREVSINVFYAQGGVFIWGWELLSRNIICIFIIGLSLSWNNAIMYFYLIVGWMFFTLDVFNHSSTNVEESVTETTVETNRSLDEFTSCQQTSTEKCQATIFFTEQQFTRLFKLGISNWQTNNWLD